MMQEENKNILKEAKPKALKIGVISIGNELLKGLTLNTNLTALGEHLLKSGFEISSCRIIRDSAEDITDNLEDMLTDEYDIILTTGGLGPTVDDITKECICKYFDLKLIRNAEIYKQILNHWQQKDTEIPESVFNQALTPDRQCTVMQNQNGTAPGLIVHIPKTKRRIRVQS